MLRPVAWPLCDPTRGRALSEDTPPERAPWSKTEVVTCVVVERWMWEKGWVEGACSEVGVGEGNGDIRRRFNRPTEPCPESTQLNNRWETADRKEMPKAVSQGGVSCRYGERSG